MKENDYGTKILKKHRVNCALLSMIPPLATDLYMPAIPEMTKHFHTTSTLMSSTMTIFFVFMAIGILVLGPMSDQ